jgi:lipoate-protein ligase A
MIPCRYFVDPPGSGAWNMAVDEYLLEHAQETGAVSIRLYGWREPTLSLGYFQGHAERLEHAPSVCCPLVRRRSGGGALLHDREITYSLTVTLGQAGIRHPEDLYQAVHQAWIDILSSYLQVRLWECGIDTPEKPSHLCPSTQGPPFLCFQRRSRWDVVFQNTKILGSAQRRRHRVLLQHGSLLLQRSEFAPELAGFGDIADMQVNATQLASEWAGLISKTLGFRLKPQPLADSEQRRIDYLQSSVFGSETFTFRR